MKTSTPVKLEDITRDDFDGFCRVRDSNVVNMFDSRVPKLAGITKDKHAAIIHFWKDLKAKWPDVAERRR